MSDRLKIYEDGLGFKLTAKQRTFADQADEVLERTVVDLLQSVPRPVVVDLMFRALLRSFGSLTRGQVVQLLRGFADSLEHGAYDQVFVWTEERGAASNTPQGLNNSTSQATNG